MGKNKKKIETSIEQFLQTETWLYWKTLAQLCASIVAKLFIMTMILILSIYLLVTIPFLRISVQSFIRDSLTGGQSFTNNIGDDDKELSITSDDDMVSEDLPLHNCSICYEMKGVDTVFNISQEEFVQRYAFSSVPVVIKNAIKDWPALTQFSYQFFQQLYASLPPESEQFTRCQFFPYRTKFQDLREALNMNESEALSGIPILSTPPASEESSPPLSSSKISKPWYIGWNNCDPNVTKILGEYYRRPEFLPTNSGDSHLDWIFMGSPGYGANMHIDHVGHPSWQAQIKGAKRWTIQPPPECLFKCFTHTVEVHSGDIIVLDTDKWYHETFIIGNELSIAIGSEYE
ncbi:uncharacterized protein LOC141851837 [Brevipalpus obovatus]|uniref:uncharacterized protein LOC141851837 n=1 Tax=Brevipalpus obovatus TaxID=246614 RepID=UPI003D9EE988